MILSRLHTLRSPVLKYPVVIIESDDWGAGPEAQAEALADLIRLLRQFRDQKGHPAVMTIGVVLSLPDIEGILVSGCYKARYLHEPDFRSVVEILLAGAREGVFDLQLHGLAHYWPDNLMAAWRKDEAVRRWLLEDGWQTEKLPAWLQSRWIDTTSGLPSRPLGRESIGQAVQAEVVCFQRCFGRRPKVVVPPTFVWDADVEAAYAEAGLVVLITPGRGYNGRSTDGRLVPSERLYRSLERLPCGLTALVRDIYFEPALGHNPQHTLEAIAAKWQRREPAMLETHRFNFLDNSLQSSLNALGTLLEQTLVQFPGLRFMSSYELATGEERFAMLPWGHARVLWRRLKR